MLDHLDVGKEIDHITEAAFVQLWPCKVLRQNILESLVLFFNASHGIVNHRADLRRMRCLSNLGPTSFRGNKENTLRGILVDILLESLALCEQFLILILETIRNIFEENQSQYNILVFGCVHVPTQHAGCVPDLFLEPYRGGVLFCHDSLPHSSIICTLFSILCVDAVNLLLDDLPEALFIQFNTLFRGN